MSQLRKHVHTFIKFMRFDLDCARFCMKDDYEITEGIPELQKRPNRPVNPSQLYHPDVEAEEVKVTKAVADNIRHKSKQAKIIPDPIP